MSYWDKYKVHVPEGTSGEWAVERFVVQSERSIPNLRIALAGRMTVPPGTYTRLVSIRRSSGWHDPIMSDTPAECEDLYLLFSQATGRVLINGLGLGVALKGVLALPTVTHVDVVEISEDIIKLVWPTYASDPRVKLHRSDAFTMLWPRGTRWNVVWHDIWPTLCSDHLHEMTRLHRKYGRRCDWQESWCRDYMRRLARNGT